MGVNSWEPFQMLINAGARTRSVEVSADDEREVVGGDEIDEVFELFDERCFDGTRRAIYRRDDEGSPAVIEFEVEAFKFSMSRRSNVGGLQFMTWMTAMPSPRLSFEEPRCWWTVVKLSGARLDCASRGIRWYPGFSQNEDVECPSCMLSFMRAALLTADLELSRPNFRLAWCRLQVWFKRCNLNVGANPSRVPFFMRK